MIKRSIARFVVQSTRYPIRIVARLFAGGGAAHERVEHLAGGRHELADVPILLACHTASGDTR